MSGKTGIREAMSMPNRSQSDLTPPQAIEMEEAVLGAILIDKNALMEVSDVLQEQMFYKDAHAVIYKAVLDLVKANKAIDLLTVTHHLRATENLERVGGMMGLTNLTLRVASAANIRQHAYFICQKFIQRELIQIGMIVTAESYSPTADAFEMLEKAQSELIRLSTEYIPSGQKTIKEAIEQVGVEISERAEGNKPTGSVLSTMASVNRQLGGYNNSDLVVLGARSGMGKTAYIVSEAVGMALAGEPVGFFSLEMSTTQIVYRIASQVTQIDNRTLSREQMTTEQVARFYSYCDKIKALPIYFDDTPAIKIQQLRAKAHKMKERYGIKILFIDYLQLIQSEGYSRENEVANVSKTLKQIAKELNIPIIVLSQLSRKCEERADKKPILSDLRESGSLEQDSDIVGFLFRPSYYGFENDEDGNPIAPDYAELIVAKFRNGETGIVPLRYKGSLTMYSDPESTWNQSVNESIKRNDSFLTAGKGGSPF